MLGFLKAYNLPAFLPQVCSSMNYPMVISVMLWHQHRPFCKTHNAPLTTSSFLPVGNLPGWILSATIFMTDISKAQAIITVNQAIGHSTQKIIVYISEICVRQTLLFPGRKENQQLEMCADCSQKNQRTFDFVLTWDVGTCVRVQLLCILSCALLC